MRGCIYMMQNYLNSCKVMQHIKNFIAMPAAPRLYKELNSSEYEYLRCRDSCLSLWSGGFVYKVEEVLKEDAAVLAQSHLAGAAGGVAFRATLNLIT